MKRQDIELIQQLFTPVETAIRQFKETLEGLTVSGSAGSTTRRLTPTQADVLRVLTDEPQTSQVLARRAERAYCGRFRENLANLVEQGLARRTRRGYLRP